VDYARGRIQGARIVLFGSSMGGAAAVRAVAEDPTLADALVLDGAYANLEEAARGFWHVTGFKSMARMMAPAAQVGRVWLGKDPRSIDLRGHYAKLKGVPVLFLYGTKDQVVPVKSAEQCVASAEGQVEWFEGCGHAQGRFAEPERYFSSIVAFLNAERLLDPVPLDNKTQEPKIISSVRSV
jgi:pimeloyl-ACP methyl ester carboxylesterase